MLSTADQDWKILCKPVKGLHIRLIVEEDYKLLIFHYVTPPPAQLLKPFMKLSVV